MKTVSPSAMFLPPYIVFCAVNSRVFRGSRTSAFIANTIASSIAVLERQVSPDRVHAIKYILERVWIVLVLGCLVTWASPNCWRANGWAEVVSESSAAWRQFFNSIEAFCN